MGWAVKILEIVLNGGLMGKIAKELDNKKNGDRNNCPICNPVNLNKRVTASQVWAATQRFGGKSHRDG